jgi:solute carrier family 25 phosphate transporter 23/24/25/41
VAIGPAAGERGYRSFVAGALAGALAQTLTAPLERLRLLLQVSGTRTGIAPGLVGIYRDGGLRAFWRGNLANVAKVAPGAGMRLWTFERAKGVLCADGEATHLLEKLLCGAVAGAVSMSAIYPLETIKTCMAVAPTGTYAGVADCVRKLLRGEGVRALYPGYVPSLIGILPYSGVDLMVYTALKEEYARVHPGTAPGPLTLLLCGALSSGLGQGIAYPLVLVRTRLQAQQIPGNPKYRGMFHCFQATVASARVGGLYRGLTANFLKMLPSTGIFYITYEAAMRTL